MFLLLGYYNPRLTKMVEHDMLIVNRKQTIAFSLLYTPLHSHSEDLQAQGETFCPCP